MTDSNNLPAVASQDEAKSISLYKVLANSPKIAVTKSETVRAYVRDLIKKTYFESGQGMKIDGKDLDNATDLLVKDLFSRFARITLPEIGEAFSKGVRGDFGEWFGLNVITFNNWIKAFLQCEERAKALNRVPGVEQQLKPVEVSPEEKERIGKEAFKNCLASYRKTGIVNDFGNGVYAFLHSHGLVKVTNGDVKQAYAEESERIRKVIADCKVALNRIGVGKAESELMELDRNENISFNLAKKKAVKNYFDSLPTNQ